MKKIGIFTTTRGDMAILTPLIRALKSKKNFKPYFFVGGTHLGKNYGNTLREIKNLNIKVNGYFITRQKQKQDSPYFLSKVLAEDQARLAKIFKKYPLDCICLVGDRYEKMAVVMNSILFKKKLIHFHGGEVTLGSFDNQVRNMFSKASDLHFVICKKYKENLIDMGVNKDNIYNIGSLAIENIKNLRRTNKNRIFKKIGLNFKKKFCILNYHPPSLDEKIKFEKQIKNIFESLRNLDIQIVVTTPGFDSGRAEIINKIKRYKKKNKNIIYTKSLGFNNFFRLIPFCEFVIGNSSSGIIEVPYFKVPTIDVGLRQFGRYKHRSIISCDYKISSIKKSIDLALSKKFKTKLKKMKFEFGNGKASKKLVKILNKKLN